MKKTKDIIDEPIKAILFGNFYERIILCWFEEKGLFHPLEGKPKVFWKDINYSKRNIEAANELKMVLRENIEEGYYCLPDGLLEKRNKFYLWEAKNWPLWHENKEPLDQLRDLLFSMPMIMTTKAYLKGKPYPISGILFSWWTKPKGVNSLIKEINNLITPRTIRIFYTDKILEECIRQKYSCYLHIILEEEKKIKNFFSDLKP